MSRFFISIAALGFPWNLSMSRVIQAFLVLGLVACGGPIVVGYPLDAGDTTDSDSGFDGGPGVDGGSDAGTHKRVFVTSAWYRGNVAIIQGGDGGLGSVDRFCMLAAETGNLGGTWRAWISNETTNAIDRIADVGPWFLVDGGPMVFPNKAALTGVPLVAINITNLGLPLADQPGGFDGVWTGTEGGALVDGYTCENWTSDSFPTLGTFGLWTKSDARWTNSVPGTRAGGACDDRLHLYCFEQ